MKPRPRPSSLVEAGYAVPRARAKGSVVPRLALRVPDEAAAAVGCSPDFFDEHLRAELKLVRLGRLVFVAVSELDAYLGRMGSRIRDEVGG